MPKLAKGLFDIIDDRVFYHSTDVDFDLLRPSEGYRGAGIFGHESADATGKYGKRTIPFKVRGKIADESSDKSLNEAIESAGLVPLEGESSANAYKRLIQQAPEKDVQSVFKSAGYGAYSRPTKKGDIVQAFDAGSIMQLDRPSKAATGLISLTAAADSARAAEIGDTDTRDVGSVQAAKHPSMQKLAGLLSQIDTPVGKPFENIPNSLLAMAYGDDPDLLRSFLSATDIAP